MLEKETIKEKLEILWYRLGFKFRDIKRYIRYHISTPRKKMRDAVFPPEYFDLDHIVVQFHLQCIIEFVEREKYFENTVWDWNEESKAKGLELKEAYEYAKTGRAKLQEDINGAWKFINNLDEPDPFKDLNEKEDWLFECDTQFCKWVVENRKLLWT